jgi:peptidoglycan hydrolase-like protein with peptidoglycan-binding domain
METLAYLHLALENEAPASTYCQATETTRERPKLFADLYSLRFSTSAAIHLLSFAVAAGILGIAHQASALVQQGDSGSEVTALQQRLQELGYFQGNATGYFGTVTKAAVKDFQQAKGLNPDGVVGSNTDTTLHEPRQSSTQAVSDSGNGVLKIGSRGESVTAVQQKLSNIGIPVGEQGVFDQTTQEGVRQFQQAKGLTVDGIVGQQTLAALPQAGSKPSFTDESKPSFTDESKSSFTEEAKPTVDEAKPTVTDSQKSSFTDEAKPSFTEKAKPSPAPKKNTRWYEDKSAPLTPFTK